ncbi:MAG: hypothetical protein SGARI_005212 [Bacillariaceae sp.]
MVKLTFDVPLDDERQQWDLHQSFDAMDDAKLGRLSISQAYTLILGLGYLQDYKAQDRFTPQILKDAVQTIQQQEQEEQGTVQYSEDGMDENGVDGEWHGFNLLAGGDNTGSINASDVQILAKEMGDPISKEEAEAMITMTQQIAHGTSSEAADASLAYATFQKLMDPPDA